MFPLNPGLLRHLVTIEAYTTTRDTDGAAVPTPFALATVWAAIDTLSGRELLSAQQIHAEVTHKITIRYRPEVRSDMRIKYGARLFEVLSPLHDEGRRTRTELLCKEMDG